MIVLIFNKSRKKSFRRTKRIISSVLPPLSNRLNIGSIPRRIILQLIDDLKKVVNRGTKIEFYIEDSDGYMGFKMVSIGKKSKESFFEIPTKFDRFLDLPPKKEPKKK